MEKKSIEVQLWSLGDALIILSCSGYLWSINPDKIWIFLMCSVGFIGSSCLAVRLFKIRNHQIFKKVALLDFMFTCIPMPVALVVKHLLKTNNIESNVTLVLVYGILATIIFILENKLIREFLQENK